MTYPAEVRERAVELVVEQGWTCKAVARRFGVSRPTVGLWVAALGYVFAPGAKCGGVMTMPEGDFTSGTGPGRRLTQAGRGALFLLHRQGHTVSEMARQLGVSRPTVYRELRRCPPGRYGIGAAHRHAQAQRQRAGRPRIRWDQGLREQVMDRLRQGHSPQQIARRLRIDFPDRDDMRVSHETIYQYLYCHGKDLIKQEILVEQALRSGRTSRRPRSQLPARNTRTWIGDHNHITTREPAADQRVVPGHWEGDLVIGGDQRTALITLVERSTRYVLMSRLPLTHDALTVGDKLADMIKTLPHQLRRSLAWDQGVEMARYADFGIDRNIQVVFCDPHSPWQRPTNENTNGLIRQYFPKGTNFADVTDERVQQVATLLNTRPRMTLNWLTPHEKLNQTIGVTLTP